MKSFFISILSITASSAVAEPPKDFDRIVGGEDISPGDYPYFVFFPIGCGGALIAPDLVLTAAHCLNRANDQVHIGAYEKNKLSAGSQERFCEEWIAHPSFDDENFFDLDFALCKLNKPVAIDQSRILLELNEDAVIPSGGEDLIAIGLGRLEDGGNSLPDIVQEVTVPAVNNAVCNQIDDITGFGPPAIYLDVINENKLCAGFVDEGGKDACQGDSGGPLIRRSICSDGSIVDSHVGITSYGLGCAVPGFPGVYARTSAGMDWIKDTACNTLQSTADFCDNGALAEPAEPCQGPELTYTVAIASDPGFAYTLVSSGKSTIFERNYLIADYVNEHKVCLEYDTEYTFKIGGGGGCSEDELCGWFSLSIDGLPILVGSGRDYTSSKIFGFQTLLNCDDSEEPFILKQEEETCENIAGLKKKKREKKCATKAAKKNCPGTCDDNCNLPDFCIDDPDFFIGGDPEQDCVFVQSNPNKCNKEKVMKKCRKTCDLECNP
jgi:secreted trypsin-like serine protease